MLWNHGWNAVLQGAEKEDVHPVAIDGNSRQQSNEGE